jgi:hypothetical protein
MLLSLFILLQFPWRFLLLHPPSKLSNLVHNKAIPLLRSSGDETHSNKHEERKLVRLFFLPFPPFFLIYSSFLSFRVCREVQTYQNTGLYGMLLYEENTENGVRYTALRGFTDNHRARFEQSVVYWDCTSFNAYGLHWHVVRVRGHCKSWSCYLVLKLIFKQYIVPNQRRYWEF